MGLGSPDLVPAALPAHQAVGEQLDQRRLGAVLHTPAAPGGCPLVAQDCGRESGGQEGTGTPPPARGSRERGRRPSPGRAGSSSANSSTSGLRLRAKVRRESEPPRRSPAAIPPLPPLPEAESERRPAGEAARGFPRPPELSQARGGGGGAAGARPLDAPASAEASGGLPKVSGRCPPGLPARPSAAPGRFLGGRTGSAPGHRLDGRGRGGGARPRPSHCGHGGRADPALPA